MLHYIFTPINIHHILTSWPLLDVLSITDRMVVAVIALITMTMNMYS